jgi:hypothetical protein
MGTPCALTEPACAEAIILVADAADSVDVLRNIAGHAGLSTTQCHPHPDRQSIAGADELLSKLTGEKSLLAGGLTGFDLRPLDPSVALTANLIVFQLHFRRSNQQIRMLASLR